MDWEGEEEKVNRGWIAKYINYNLLFQDWHATPCGIIFQISKLLFLPLS